MRSIKRIMAFVAVVCGLWASGLAQIDIEALGGRLGVGNGFDLEGSAQFSFGSYNRIEADLGMSYVTVSDSRWVYMNLTGIYQWKWRLDRQIDWYAGVGGNVGFYSGSRDDYFGLGLAAAGQVGIEYNFRDIPLQLSADLRPRLALIGRVGFDATIGLSARYRF